MQLSFPSFCGILSSSFNYVNRSSTSFPAIPRRQFRLPRVGSSAGPVNRSSNIVALLDIKGGQGYLIFFPNVLSFSFDVDLSVY